MFTKKFSLHAHYRLQLFFLLHCFLWWWSSSAQLGSRESRTCLHAECFRSFSPPFKTFSKARQLAHTSCSAQFPWTSFVCELPPGALRVFVLVLLPLVGPLAPNENRIAFLSCGHPGNVSSAHFHGRIAVQSYTCRCTGSERQLASQNALRARETVDHVVLGIIRFLASFVLKFTSFVLKGFSRKPSCHDAMGRKRGTHRRSI
jgi:hypothetical protein